MYTLQLASCTSFLLQHHMLLQVLCQSLSHLRRQLGHSRGQQSLWCSVTGWQEAGLEAEYKAERGRGGPEGG